MLATVVLVVMIVAHGVVGVDAGKMDQFIHVLSSIKADEIKNNATLQVPRQKFGFLLCNASSVTTDDSTHYWDYYVEWEMPTTAENDNAIFQMGNEYQMPHSYIVFQDFKPNFTGKYICRLHFRSNLVGVHTVYLALPDSPSLA
ncbi:uncharacterized protein LOC123499763 [Portunus trituberculatus]|uniref:Ig-like domain-containing protein n=1 Tax=Portunus trituberculatus TaxID=210409 RepID=A0A5B7CQ10_PORTR|nr:uncharacterized protein LOC123499763 [Portunus trituberculatus]MPC11559.1 hypothetical protein [Portunus trituberculatus]